jgi:nicotinate dehydrogenase subunit B
MMQLQKETDRIRTIRLSRRDALRLSALLGTGLVVACARAPSLPMTPASEAPDLSTANQAPTSAAAALPKRALPTDVDAYLKIGQDGSITLFTGKVEYGQGIETGFAQLAAEELDVPLDRVKVVMGITNQAPFDNGTSGSQSTRSTGPIIRQAAAEMHQWLLELGSARLGVPADQLQSKDGSVVGDSGQTVSYADLASGQTSGRSTQGTATLKDPSLYSLVGESAPRRDLPEKVDGRMKYGYDSSVSGMVYGKIVRPPSWGAMLQSIDFSAARGKPGVVGVFRDGDFAGLAAERPEQAVAALAAVKASWAEKGSPYTSENIFDALKSTKDGGRSIGPSLGDVDGALQSTSRKVTVRVTAPYVAHAPMEPMMALVHVQPDKTEIWTSTQVPFDCQDACARTLNIPREQVTVYPLMSGGAFGRKNLTDAVVETTRLARAMGRPVKVQWTREEEFQWEHARPAILVELTAALDAGGHVNAWDWASYATAYFPEGSQTAVSSGADAAANVQDYYAIPNVRSTFYQGVAPLPPQYWRANGSPVNSLARESAIDELAEMAGVDPVSFRESLLVSKPRLAAVMHAAVEKSGWKPSHGSSGQGYGIGLAWLDGTYIAEVAKVSVDKSNGKVHVDHVDCAVDCGLVVNPTAVKRQIEGSIVMHGTSSTMNEQLTFSAGKVTTTQLAIYKPMGFLDAPTVDVVFVEDKHQPMQGIGEPAVAGVSAAISNAIYDAVGGSRLRDLPFLPAKVQAAVKA